MCAYVLSVIRFKTDYRHSKLGYLWEYINLIFITGFLYAIWSRVLNESEKFEYFLYVFIGFHCWGLISRLLDHSSSFRSRAIGLLRRNHSTLFEQVISDIVYCLIPTALTVPLVLTLVLVTVETDLLSFICAIYSLFMILVSGASLIVIVGLSSFYIEDISRFIKTVMRVAFLLTPILWTVEMLPESERKLVYLNPFYSYIDVYRTALLGQEVSSLSLIVMTVISLITVTFAFLCFLRLSPRIIVRIFNV